MRLFILIGILLVSVLVSGKAQTVRIVKEEQSIRLLFMRLNGRREYTLCLVITS